MVRFWIHSFWPSKSIFNQYYQILIHKHDIIKIVYKYTENLAVLFSQHILCSLSFHPQTHFYRFLLSFFFLGSYDIFFVIYLIFLFLPMHLLCIHIKLLFEPKTGLAISDENVSYRESQHHTIYKLRSASGSMLRVWFSHHKMNVIKKIITLKRQIIEMCSNTLNMFEWIFAEFSGALIHNFAQHCKI